MIVGLVEGKLLIKVVLQISRKFLTLISIRSSTGWYFQDTLQVHTFQKMGIFGKVFKVSKHIPLLLVFW